MRSVRLQADLASPAKAGRHVEKENVPEVRTPDVPKLQSAIGGHGPQGSDDATTRPPARRESAADVVRSALCVEPRGGVLHIFMPPVEAAEDYLELERMCNAPLPQDYPRQYPLEDSRISPEQFAEDVAQEERNRLGLGDAPIGDLRAVFEEAVGLRVFFYEIVCQKWVGHDNLP